MGGSDKRQRTTQPEAIDVRSPSNRKKEGVQEVRGVQEFKEKETGDKRRVERFATGGEPL